MKCKGVFHTVGFIKKLRNIGIMILKVNFRIDFFACDLKKTALRCNSFAIQFAHCVYDFEKQK